MDSYLLATVDVRVVRDEVGGATDEQVQADDVYSRRGRGARA
jgi:hypothetical protein